MSLTTNESGARRLLTIGFAAFLLVVSIGACAGAGEPAEVADTTAAEHGEADGHEGEDSAEHVHPAGEDIPSRADEMDRDEYSKPLEVYAFGGIAEGDTVVDIGAGTGYNTYLLSGLVGPAGKVYAERGNEGLAARIEHGDLAEAGNIEIVASRDQIPSGSADAIVLVREYHLVEDYLGLMADLRRILKDDGSLVVVEVRNNQATGHDMATHRLGEETVVAQFAEGGFTLADQSDILRRDDDDYAVYGGPVGLRYVTDRMLMRFVKTP